MQLRCVSIYALQRKTDETSRSLLYIPSEMRHLQRGVNHNQLERIDMFDLSFKLTRDEQMTFELLPPVAEKSQWNQTVTNKRDRKKCMFDRISINLSVVFANAYIIQRVVDKMSDGVYRFQEF
jgi:hypothetical protein